MGKRLVILVPGMGALEPDQYLDRLLNGLHQFCNDRQIAQSDPEEQGERRRKRLTVDAGEAPIDIEFVEAFWSDLRPRLSAQSISGKLVRGWTLLVYWFGSARVWARAIYSKYMLVNAAATMLLTVAWYYGAIATFFMAVGSQPEALAPIGGSNFGVQVGAIGQSMGGWRVWLVASAVSALLPLQQVTEICYAGMAYLKNVDHFATKARARVSKVLFAALKHGVSDIVVVAHSFGVAVAVEALASLETDRDVRIQFVSLGGCLRLLAARSERLSEAAIELSSKSWLSHWADFWCNDDWLGAPTPEWGPNDKLSSQELQATTSLDDRLRGRTHDLYFAEPEVFLRLIDAPPHPPPA